MPGSRTTPFLGKGTLTVSQIFYTSPSRCAVADSCAISVDRRLTFGEDKDLAISQIENLPSVKGRRRQGQGVHVHLRSPLVDRPRHPTDCYFPTWVLPEDHVVTKSTEETYRSLFGREPRTDKWTFSTNGVSIMGRYGIPVVGFGPGKEKGSPRPPTKRRGNRISSSARPCTQPCQQLTSPTPTKYRQLPCGPPPPPVKVLGRWRGSGGGRRKSFSRRVPSPSPAFPSSSGATP